MFLISQEYVVLVFCINNVAFLDPVRRRAIFAYSVPLGPDFLSQSTLILKCTAHSKPSASITWQNLNNNVKFTGDTWTIRNLDLMDKGIYVCTAKNVVSGVTYNVSTSLSVNVREWQSCVYFINLNA